MAGWKIVSVRAGQTYASEHDDRGGPDLPRLHQRNPPRVVQPEFTPCLRVIGELMLRCTSHHRSGQPRRQYVR